jgi:hypothetical protein
MDEQVIRRNSVGGWVGGVVVISKAILCAADVTQSVVIFRRAHESTRE